MRIYRNHDDAAVSQPPVCGGAAFTLIEVMIAMGIFFMAVFAILTLVSSSLRNAHALQEPPVDASPIIAIMWLTNGVVEGNGGGDFGDLYPGYTWESNSISRDDFPTNGLYEVDFNVRGPQNAGGSPAQSHLWVLQWNPRPPALKP
jgi:hypothetical protein